MAGEKVFLIMGVAQEPIWGRLFDESEDIWDTLWAHLANMAGKKVVYWI